MGLDKDKFQECYECGHMFAFDTSMIRKGQKYGMRCPKCGTDFIMNKSTKSVLEVFEEENHVLLPRSYEIIMKSFDKMKIPESVQLYHVDKDPTINIRDNDRPDGSYIVIGRMSNGDPVLCKSGEETIYIYNHETGRIEEDEVYPNLFVFLEVMKREENA